MTKKRFIKLLMGIGISRNQAEVFAYWKHKWLKPYAQSWNDYAATLSHNLRFSYLPGEPGEDIILRDLNYLELHKNER